MSICQVKNQKYPFFPFIYFFFLIQSFNFSTISVDWLFEKWTSLFFKKLN